jgi:hypothetical protein
LVHGLLREKRPFRNTGAYLCLTRSEGETDIRRLLIATTVLVGLACQLPAEAAYVVTITQDGSDVVATGSGSLDLATLTDSGVSLQAAVLDPSFGSIFLGATTSALVDAYYVSFAGPGSLGSGGYASPESGSGPLVGRSNGGGGLILVPDGYVSGTSLGTSTDTWDNTTIAALGVTPGTYTWTWGVVVRTPIALPWM